MPIQRLQGKWKMSQNRTAQDQSGVIAGLQADGEQKVAAIVAESCQPAVGWAALQPTTSVPQND
jgi:predicted FMN-binding regulatory protein PaiB